MDERLTGRPGKKSLISGVLALLLITSAGAVAFDFDKVLLFSREPGGNGEVFEIQRA